MREEPPANQDRRQTKAMRKDNFRFTCGHTGHITLPSRYDRRKTPVPAVEFMVHQNPLLARREWRCPPCAEEHRVNQSMAQSQVQALNIPAMPG